MLQAGPEGMSVVVQDPVIPKPGCIQVLYQQRIQQLPVWKNKEPGMGPDEGIVYYTAVDGPRVFLR